MMAAASSILRLVPLPLRTSALTPQLCRRAHHLQRQHQRRLLQTCFRSHASSSPLSPALAAAVTAAATVALAWQSNRRDTSTTAHCALFRADTEDEKAEALARKARRRALRTPALKKLYKVGKRIGAGRYAVVYEGRDRSTNQRVALKLIDRQASTPMDLAREMVLMKLMGHHGHSVRLLRVVDCGPSYLVLVLERAEGGELFDLIHEVGALDEAHARRFVGQLARALHLMHAQGLSHCDLKPENVLLTRRSVNADVLLADFGQSRIQDDIGAVSRPGRFFAGTWSYSAPESMRDGPVNMSAADMWSLGVMTYVMLCGIHPFDPSADDPDGVVVGRILRGKYDKGNSCYRQLGRDVKDLIQALLRVDARERLTANDMLAHPFLRPTDEEIQEEAERAMLQQGGGESGSTGSSSSSSSSSSKSSSSSSNSSNSSVDSVADRTASMGLPMGFDWSATDPDPGDHWPDM